MEEKQKRNGGNEEEEKKSMFVTHNSDYDSLNLCNREIVSISAALYNYYNNEQSFE